MTSTTANGQSAMLAHARESDRGWHPHAVHVLTIARDGLAHLAVFLDPTICQYFTPATADASDSSHR
jgi:hypothetical protein